MKTPIPPIKLEPIKIEAYRLIYGLVYSPLKMTNIFTNSNEAVCPTTLSIVSIGGSALPTNIEKVVVIKGDELAVD